MESACPIRTRQAKKLASILGGRNINLRNLKEEDILIIQQACQTGNRQPDATENDLIKKECWDILKYMHKEADGQADSSTDGYHSSWKLYIQGSKKFLQDQYFQVLLRCIATCDLI